jgi:carbohydrate-selective porin OprB
MARPNFLNAVLSIAVFSVVAFLPEALVSESSPALQQQATAVDNRPSPHSAIGLKDILQNRGIDVNSSVTEDVSRSMAGGTPGDDGFMRYSLDLSVTVDGSKGNSWKGGKAHADFKQHKSLFGKPYEGVAETYSNIDAAPYSGLYELWGEQTFFGERIRAKGGKIDANTEFATVATAAEFLNSSMGYSPTIMELPTYPDPQFGILAAVTPGRNVQAMLGAFQVAGGGKIGLGEVAQSWNLQGQNLPGRVSVGSWILRKNMAHFDNSPAHGAAGFYATAEQTVWRRSAGNDQAADRRLSAFLQYGTGRGSVDPYVYHLGGGTVLEAPSRTRSNDAIGMAVSRLHFSEDPMCGYSAKAETLMEAYYRLKMTSHLSLITDTQLFLNAGGRKSASTYMVATPRLVMTF